MLDGGVREGDSVLIAGSSGTGKSVLATQFIAEGISQGEPGIVAVFEERPQAYTERATSLGLDLETPQKEGKLTILYLRPLDLSVDETMQSILDAVQKIGAKRLVIDSLAGFEMALSPGFRADFRESLYRMIFALTGIGVTILSTVEVDESFTEFPFSTYSISFLCDDIIRLRYVSIDGQLRKIMVVIKMRGGNHAKDIREYEITSKGVVILGQTPHELSGSNQRNSCAFGPVQPSGRPDPPLIWNSKINPEETAFTSGDLSEGQRRKTGARPIVSQERLGCEDLPRPCLVNAAHSARVLTIPIVFPKVPRRFPSPDRR